MKLVAADLDDTLVRPDRTISDRTVAAFDALPYARAISCDITYHSSCHP